nr:MAG TPA: hypothetical protein [Caudoviricetes sp.]
MCRASHGHYSPRCGIEPVGGCSVVATAQSQSRRYQ